MGFTFNGVTSSSKKLYVLSISKSALPSIKINTQELPNIGGTVLLNKRYDVREITFNCLVTGTSDSDFETKIRDIAKWLNTDTPQQLILDEEPNKYYMAMVSEISEIEQTLAIGKFSIKFVCLNPYAYATSSTTVTIQNGSSSATINNDGDTTVYPTISFTSWASNITISNSSTGESIELIGLPTNKTVSIKCETGEIVVDGVVNMSYLGFNSVLFGLETGNNTISVGTTSHNTVTISFTKQYI